MKLAEAFAKRTYGGKGAPREITDAHQKKINATFIKALEEQMMAHLYAMWDDMREDPDLMDDVFQDDFPAYMKAMTDDPHWYIDVVDSWMDFRKTGIERKMVQMAKDRFK